MKRFLLILILSGCSKEIPKQFNNEPIKRGEAFYRMNCISCHNPNPSLDGSVGPAIKNSSYELLKEKLLSSSYPNGYKPKRDTNFMPKFPYLENEVLNISMFLNYESQN